MRRTRLVASIASFTLVALVGTAAVAVQEHQMSESEQKMVEAWVKAATPGAEQARLAKLAGTWDLVVKSWWAPGGPPMEAKGVMTGSMILGGRFYEAKVLGDVDPSHPERFGGVWTMAFDNVTRKWQSTWIDTLSTGISRAEASVGDGKTVNWTGVASNPMTGKEKTLREVHTFTNDNQWTSETFENGPDGKEYKSMEIVFTRRKAG